MTANTERITVRLPRALIHQMDALVDVGDFRNRTDVVYNALKAFVRERGAHAKEAIEAEKGLLEFQKLAAEMREMKARLGLE